MITANKTSRYQLDRLQSMQLAIGYSSMLHINSFFGHGKGWQERRDLDWPECAACWVRLLGACYTWDWTSAVICRTVIACTGASSCAARWDLLQERAHPNFATVKRCGFRWCNVALITGGIFFGAWLSCGCAPRDQTVWCSACLQERSPAAYITCKTASPRTQDVEWVDMVDMVDVGMHAENSTASCENIIEVHSENIIGSIEIIKMLFIYIVSKQILNLFLEYFSREFSTYSTYSLLSAWWMPLPLLPPKQCVWKFVHTMHTSNTRDISVYRAFNTVKYGNHYKEEICTMIAQTAQSTSTNIWNCRQTLRGDWA